VSTGGGFESSWPVILAVGSIKGEVNGVRASMIPRVLSDVRWSSLKSNNPLTSSTEGPANDSTCVAWRPETGRPDAGEARLKDEAPRIRLLRRPYRQRCAGGTGGSAKGFLDEGTTHSYACARVHLCIFDAAHLFRADAPFGAISAIVPTPAPLTCCTYPGVHIVGILVPRNCSGVHTMTLMRSITPSDAGCAERHRRFADAPLWAISAIAPHLHP